ncbi:chemotaxis response regulator protein-glutamate methylesterase [Spongisporangium articulatum]|uniref:Protein-glutamate methylesterase/protein-glutamine glutaminase n=1 Tax=Spongisporangium articulatum TaxID=3362603 RepID=A0ABW8AMA3_9ACTN
MTGRIKVLVVDDSAVVRQVLSSVLAHDPDIEVASVSDPIFAMERMKKDWPDALVLDIEMPRMDGLTFLRKLMAVRPTPVVICSTLTEKGAETTMQAMAAGAIGFVTKPTSGLRDFLTEDGGEIVRAVKAAAAGNVRSLRATTDTLARQVPPQSRGAGDAAASKAPARGPLSVTTDRLVAIGTSTGGTQALELVLSALPRVNPGIVVVQHMPEKFTAAFAARLNRVCAAEVAEGRDGERILPGRILIAPGGRHMEVERVGAQYRVKITDAERVNRHRPSVDVLFESTARHAGANALGVILTGMGDDGARGLLKMRTAGARTLGQDERSCVVYGMPGAAQQLGAVERELPLDEMAGAIENYSRSMQ